MKLLRYSLLLLAAFLWLGGCSRDIMRLCYRTGIIQDEYRFGDLYRLSNLPQFKELQKPCDTSPQQTDRAASLSDNNPVNLFILGDSFTEWPRIRPDNLRAAGIPVKRYHYTHWAQQHRIQLDSSQHNILLLESVERHFREHFANKVGSLSVVADTNQQAAGLKPSWRRQLFDQIQSKGIEERLETILFSQPLFDWLKECKAALTLHWFDRWSPKVGLSTDRRHIFVDLDVDTTKHLNSSFSALSDQEVDALVDSVNATARRYRQAGFDAVYLSLIPNKASILEPSRGQYNHLIERIQRHPRLQVPVIDVYSSYKKSRQPVYAIGDSHWNCLGQQLWLQETVRCMTPAQ